MGQGSEEGYVLFYCEKDEEKYGSKKVAIGNNTYVFTSAILNDDVDSFVNEKQHGYGNAKNIQQAVVNCSEEELHTAVAHNSPKPPTTVAAMIGLASKPKWSSSR